MNVLAVLLLFLGAFLIMDAACERRVASAESSNKNVKYVPLPIYDQQMSGNTMRDYITDMLYSTGPWMFRDNDLQGPAIENTRPENPNVHAPAAKQAPEPRPPAATESFSSSANSLAGVFHNGTGQRASDRRAKRMERTRPARQS